MYDSGRIENEYNRFLRNHADAQRASWVEYLGVNFSQEVSACPVFKAYYTTTRSMENTSCILQPLFDRNMVRALNKIDDTVNCGLVRYEIGLGNRNNSNMLFIHQWMHGLFPELKKHGDELERLYSIKCTQASGYDYAALYFLGLIAEPDNTDKPDVKAVKLHYLLRNCNDPDKIGKNYSVDNQHYFGILRSLGIPQMKELSEFAAELVGTDGAELWMAAVDYYKAGPAKYKLYLKKFSESLYVALTECFDRMGCIHLARQIHAYVQWIYLHPELERYGFAVCLDSMRGWSVNFYH